MLFPQVANLSQMCVSHVIHEHVTYTDVHARMPVFAARNQFRCAKLESTQRYFIILINLATRSDRIDYF